MAYIYDILLNFNEELIEYFLWNESDNIKYVKKIILYKVDTDILKTIINNNVEIDSVFMKKIPSYEMTGEKNAPKLLLLTDAFTVIGLLIKNNKVVLLSRLLLDEEYEILNMSNNLEYTDIKVKVLNTKNKSNDYLTRLEKQKKEDLLKQLNYLYKTKNKNKLLYLYYEYENKENSSIDYVYNYLKNSLKNYNLKHDKLFDILSLAKTNND